MLDVARETYKENVGDIYQLSNNLADQYNLPLTPIYQDTGFVFALKKNDLDGELPRGFINVSMQKGRWLFSSLDLVSSSFPSVAYYSQLTGGLSWQKKMNARMKDALDETLILSDK